MRPVLNVVGGGLGSNRQYTNEQARRDSTAYSPTQHQKQFIVPTIVTDGNGNSQNENDFEMDRSPRSSYGSSAASYTGSSLGIASGYSSGGVMLSGGYPGPQRTGNQKAGLNGVGSVPPGTGSNRVSSGGASQQRRLSSTSSDRSTNSIVSHESHPAPNMSGLSLQTGPLQAPHISRASSFRAPKAANELHVDDGNLSHIRRNSMPVVTNNLLVVPGGAEVAPGNSTNGVNDSTEGREIRLRRVRSFKTTSKGVVVNRGDSFKKKSTHSLMSTGSTVTEANSRTRGNSINNNSGLDPSHSPVGPAYFRVYMMGAAGVGKTSLAQQFLTSEYIGHEEKGRYHVGHFVTGRVVLFCVNIVVTATRLKRTN